MASSTLPALPAATALTGPELIYGVQGGADVSITPVQVAAYTGANIPASYLASPPAIGSTVPSTGAFTTLTAFSVTAGYGSFSTIQAAGAVSGAGFSTYLASPPAIGGTAPASGAFTTLSSTGLATLASAEITGVPAHQVLIGEAASPVVGVSPSTTGYVLTSNGPSADPSFQAAPGGGIVPTSVYTFGGVIINAASGTTQQALYTTQTGPTASQSGPYVYNTINISNPTQVTGDVRTMGLLVEFTNDSTTQTGDAYSIYGAMNVNAGSGNTGGDHCGIVGNAQSTQSDAGIGEIYGAIANSSILGTPTLYGSVGIEASTGIAAGATVSRRFGVRAAATGSTQATGTDSAFGAFSTGISGSFEHLLSMSNGYGASPLTTTGDWFYSDTAYTVGSWANLPNLTVSNYIMNFPGFTVSGTGNLNTNGNLIAQGGVNAVQGLYAQPAATSAASAGYIGEVIQGQGSNVSVSSATPKTITSISLTPGHWFVYGSFKTLPAGSTTTSFIDASISATNNTSGDFPGRYYAPLAAAAGATIEGNCGPVLVNITATTTYYAVMSATFASSTMNVAMNLLATRMW